MNCDLDCFNCKFPDCVASQKHICTSNPVPKKKKEKCNHDCFNCKFDDCVLTDVEAVREEHKTSSYEEPSVKKN